MHLKRIPKSFLKRRKLFKLIHALFSVSLLANSSASLSRNLDEESLIREISTKITAAIQNFWISDTSLVKFSTHTLDSSHFSDTKIKKIADTVTVKLGDSFIVTEHIPTNLDHHIKLNFKERIFKSNGSSKTIELDIEILLLEGLVGKELKKDKVMSIFEERIKILYHDLALDKSLAIGFGAAAIYQLAYIHNIWLFPFHTESGYVLGLGCIPRKDLDDEEGGCSEEEHKADQILSYSIAGIFIATSATFASRYLLKKR